MAVLLRCGNAKCTNNVKTREYVKVQHGSKVWVFCNMDCACQWYNG